MTSAEKATGAHPYESLTPDVVLDALARLGLYGDGRLMALNSYENRVYQAHLEDGRAVVLKFYRPGRWSDAQIAEEHRFSAELAAAEVPAVAPLALEGATLHHHGGFAFSVSPYRGGRAPELDDFEVLEWVGRFLARIHTVGAARPFVERPALDLQSFGLASRDWLLEHEMIPLDVQRDWEKACSEAFEMIAVTALGADTCTELQKLRLHGDVHPGNILWTPTDRPEAARTSSTSTTPAPASRCRTSGCCCRATARQRTAPAQRPARRLRAVPRLRPARAGADRAAAHPAPDPLQRLARAALATIRSSRSTSRGSARATTGRSRSRCCRTSARRWRRSRCTRELRRSSAPSWKG